LILLGDCLDILPTIGDNSVNLIYTDPPYFKVKNEAWDRQWDKPAQFLGWLGEVLEEFRRVLAPNGSLYLFASPKMAARVELKVGEYFEVLNNIRWVKSEGWHKKTNKDEIRSFLSPWESVIFAEHFGADSQAKGESGYGAKCDELRGFVFEPLRAYLDGERRRAGIDKADCNAACGFKRTSGAMASRHYFSRSQWLLPTEEHYSALQELFNREGRRPAPPYEDYHDAPRARFENPRTDYDYLRTDYDYLRTDYENLRRPFTVSSEVPYTDVWNYPTVQSYPGKHPTEKPYQMHLDVINASSRPGDTVLDAFGGSCKVYDACLELGRVPIIIEKDEGYYRAAMKRIRNKPTTLEKAMAAAERPTATLEDFAP
jgi:site-specific DNA-methyltransferase (adenine-specific)